MNKIQKNCMNVILTPLNAIDGDIANAADKNPNVKKTITAI